MRHANSLRNCLTAAAVATFLLAGSAPLFAQGTRNSGTDIQFHKFIPIVPPESAATTSAQSTPEQIHAATAQQIQLLMQEKASRTPAQRKIDSNVLFTIRMMRGQEAAPGVTSVYTGIDLDQDNRIVVDIVADVTDALLQQLQSAGALVLDSHKDYRAIRAIVPADQIEIIAASSDVSFIGRKAESITSRLKFTPSHASVKGALIPGFEGRATQVRKQISAYLQQQGARTNNQGVVHTGSGSVDTEGDAAHTAIQARGVFGVTGAGLKIGVLSDSANATGAVTAAQATGDMPPTCPGPGGPCLTILQDFAGGSDEGTAMMEIIYDMVPGANLFFATADINEASFASNIQALRTAGCDIIVDDVFYFDEPVFQDGIVAQAVNTVTAAGALYFSSAGNEGNVNAGTAGYFEGDFNDAGSAAFVFPGAPPAKTGTIHNFGTVGTPLNGDIITVAGDGYTLNWADPSGASGNDYDLFLVTSAGTIKAQSTNIQTGAQNPFEFIGPPSLAAGDRLVVFKTTAAVPLAFAINTIRGTLSINTTGQTHGHSAAVDAFSVAATPAAAAFNGVAPVGPFPNAFTTADQVEPFSSDGPRRVFFTAAGAAITPGNFLFGTNGGAVRSKPDITAADGVSTTLPGNSGLNPFYGTSAAAPSAASVAALVKSAAPALTPAQIRTTLTSTALDIMSAGNDINSGNGIVMAMAALNSLGLTGFADLEFGTITATENPGNGNGVLEPGEGGLLVIQLKNTNGVQDAKNISAVLTTTTPGVTVTLPGTSAYPNLPLGSGVGTNATAFTFTLASNLACGTVINFTLTVTYTNGPAPTKVLNFSVPIVVTLSNTLGGTTPTGMPTGMTFATGAQTGRLTRNGVVSSCGSSKANPGLFALTGARLFDAYTFTTPAGVTGCMTTTFNGANGASMFEATYTPTYSPAAPGLNFAADPGVSSPSQSYGLTATASTSYTIVVHNINVGDAGTPYTLQIPTCIFTNPATINHPPVAVVHDVTVTASTVGGTAAASIDNGSSDPDGDAITKTQTPPEPYPIGVTNVMLTVTDTKGATAQASANVTVVNPSSADLTITKTHAGNFTQGQTGANYAITVTNSGVGPTSGTVTVVDTLPASMTATGLTGSGWSCTLGTLTCTRSDALGATIAYPTITLTVTVSGSAPASVTNTATVSGGGELNVANDVATNPTTITQPADMTITKSHIGNFTLGQTGATYTITATNSGAGATSGIVTVVDTLPTGLTATAISGTGWTCTLGTLTCTRSDVLAAAASYPAITLTVNVTGTTAGNVTNTATVSGGGEIIVANDVANDVTALTQDFSESGTSSPVTVTAGQTANFTITITPGPGGFTNAITFSASGLPAASSASFNPTSFTPGSAATSTTLSISTTARGGILPSGRRTPWNAPQLMLFSLALVSMMSALLFFRTRRQRRYVPAMLVTIAFLTALVVAGCGSSAPPPPTGTSAGTSTITVTATSGSVVHTTTVTLTVQ